MAEDNTDARAFRFDNPQQERIYKRLRSIGPGPAAFYRDVCKIMADQPQLESSSHLVSHLLREIESALRAALKPMGAEQDLDSDGNGAARRNQGSQKIGTHEREIRAILLGLEIPESDPLAQAWLSLTGADNEYGLAKRAHRDSLAAPRPNDAAFREFVAQFEAVLGAVLSRMETRFATYFARIDEVLALVGNPEEKLARFANALPNNPVVLGYLFEQIAALGDPAWLGPLETHGYFRHPPAAERSQDESTGTESVRFPHWPQSQFLARMARDHHGEQAVESIARIAGGIPGTDNGSVNEDLLMVALNLPLNLGAQLAPRLGRAVESPSSGFFPEHVAEFVLELLKGGESKAAFALARQLLAVHPQEVAPLDLGDKVLQFPPNVHGSYDDWMYERVVDRLAPVLVAKQEDAALNLICDLLDDAIAKSRGADDLGEPIDLSTHWWPVLDENDEIERHVAGVMGTLARALRTAIHQLAAQDPRGAVPRVLETLKGRTWRVYRRLELDLIRSFADDVPDLIEQSVANRELLNIEPPLPEYQILAEERFSTLPTKTQQQVLDWIEEGLDTRLIEDAFQRSGHEPTPEEMALAVRRLQWERLGPIRESLPPHARDHFDALAAEFGEPKAQEGHLLPATFIGPTSPVSVNALLEMTDENLVDYLSSWSSPGEFGAPTPEGLGRAVTEAVRQAPARFARMARRFSGLDPTYARALIAGFRGTNTSDVAFDWEAVLDLCSWVIEQPREIEGRDQSGEAADPSWGWTRKEIARLMIDGLSPGPNQIPFGLRHRVWSVLVPLASDPDPTPENEEQYGGPDTNPLDFGVNTVRASVIEAVIHYAAWVRSHSSDGEATGSNWQGFATVPEAAEALTSHLDPARDPSSAVRSVYGRFLPLLTVLDHEWVRLQIPQLFPADANQTLLRDAAWETFVVANAANRPLFELLLDEYQSAIARLPAGSVGWSWRGQTTPNERLGEHLATAFIQGWVAQDEGLDLLREYYAQALPEVRAHVAEWIGRELPRFSIPIGSPKIGRLMALWESRIAEAEAADDLSLYQKELSGFGWWFINGPFDDAWAVEQLRRTLRLGSTPSFLFRVIGRLAALAEQMPRTTVKCLTLLLDHEDISDLRLSASMKEIEAILTAAITADDEDATQLASDAANRLAARGFIGFRGLVKKTGQNIDHRASG